MAGWRLPRTRCGASRSLLVGGACCCCCWCCFAFRSREVGGSKSNVNAVARSPRRQCCVPRALDGGRAARGADATGEAGSSRARALSGNHGGVGDNTKHVPRTPRSSPNRPQRWATPTRPRRGPCTAPLVRSLATSWASRCGSSDAVASLSRGRQAVPLSDHKPSSSSLPLTTRLTTNTHRAPRATAAAARPSRSRPSGTVAARSS